MKYIIWWVLSVLPIFTLAACTSQKPADLDIERILIPAGEFIMGSNLANDNANQKPQHTVFLNAYYISRFEVTNKQYKQFLLDGGYRKRKFWTPEGWKFITENQIVAPAVWNLRVFNAPDQPVVGVSWYEADAFARWAGKRLPTEAEWEKAARGTDGRIYPWGEEMGIGKVHYKAVTRPLSIGSYPEGKSPYGLYDVAGNVWEWVQDWYDANFYQESPKNNPKGPKQGTFKVMRGGAWDSNRRHMQCAYRHYEKPTWRRLNTGFRLAEDANSKSQ